MSPLPFASSDASDGNSIIVKFVAPSLITSRKRVTRMYFATSAFPVNAFSIITCELKASTTLTAFKNTRNYIEYGLLIPVY